MKKIQLYIKLTPKPAPRFCDSNAASVKPLERAYNA